MEFGGGFFGGVFELSFSVLFLFAFVNIPTFGRDWGEGWDFVWNCFSFGGQECKKRPKLCPEQTKSDRNHQKLQQQFSGSRFSRLKPGEGCFFVVFGGV